jgi:hypothetical protein
MLELALCCLFLFPGPLRSQMPQRPGRLTVTSAAPGATVSIDNRQMSRQTPFTFVLSPGQHSVSVSGKDQAGKDMYCTASMNMPAGAAKSIHCTVKGWDPPVQ